MSGLSKFVTGLIVLFALVSVALLSQLCYVLWRRRRFRRHASAAEHELSGGSYASPTKELLYFFCWKSQSRIEPDEAPSLGSGESPGTEPEPDPEDLVKWMGMSGPSRILFTIKEDERENYESERSSGDTKTKRKKKKRTSLEEFLMAESLETQQPEVTVTVDAGDKETPFSTPCASPPYYTPSPSPPRNLQKSVGDIKESSSDGCLSGESKRPVVCLEVHGGKASPEKGRPPSCRDRDG